VFVVATTLVVLGMAARGRDDIVTSTSDRHQREGGGHLRRRHDSHTLWVARSYGLL
jgi:hypothetical protein